MKIHLMLSFLLLIAFTSCETTYQYDVHAFKNDTIQGKKKWCDKSIRLEREDIGQGSFTIEYAPADF